jgi:hypothetical protein
MDWQFRVAHYGFFLNFGIVFSFRSMMFDGAIYFAVMLMLIAIVVRQTRRITLLGCNARLQPVPDYSDENFATIWLLNSLGTAMMM